MLQRAGAGAEPRLLLLTGPPGCGKTTLLRKIADDFAEVSYALLSLSRAPARRTAFEPGCIMPLPAHPRPRCYLSRAFYLLQNAAPIVKGGLRLGGFFTEAVDGPD